MAEWFSIEVLNGTSSARVWSEGYGDAIVQAGMAHGAVDWEWHHHSWGTVFEIELSDEAEFDKFRNLPIVEAALDAVPDRVNGLMIHRGRGGSAGARRPRRPRPISGSGAVALLPDDDPDWSVPSEPVAQAAILAGVGAQPASLGRVIVRRRKPPSAWSASGRQPSPASI